MTRCSSLAAWGGGCRSGVGHHGFDDTHCYGMQKMRKTIVLVLVRHYLPGHKYGGPLRTIANMVEQLSDDFDFRIVTSDRDEFDKAPFAGVVLDAWNQVGKAQVYYLSRKNKTMRGLTKLLSGNAHDVLYLNSYFDPVFTQPYLMARRLGLLPAKPVVIAPRGEFCKGALLLKYWKKAPYKWVTSAIGLYRNLIWQASTKYEAEEIRKVLGRTARHITVASDMAARFEESDLILRPFTHEREGLLRIVFLSRITPKKNLDFALSVLARLSIPVHFDIFGPIGDEPYWKRCEVLAASLPSNVTVEYKGAVEHAQVASVLKCYDLFFLPTRGENYGHVIMESLSVGTPILIADTTPWRDLEQEGAGWDLPLDNEQQFADRIQKAAEISKEAYRSWRERVHAYARKRAVDPEIIASNRRLLMDAAVRIASANGLAA
jgi:glycosyltransferase involved in cell wall biosynthesis